MDCSTPSFPVLHYLSDLVQTHALWVDDAIQPSQPLSSLSPLVLNLSQHQSFPMSRLFASGGQGIEASSSVLPMHIQGWFLLGLTSLISLPSNSRESSLAPQFKSISSSVLRLDPTLISVHDYWKNHNFDYTDLCQQRINCFLCINNNYWDVNICEKFHHMKDNTQRKYIS